jgi:hypothetical protein
MRESCKNCILKHLSKAEILLSEAELGYPEHFWLALGNLSEAEDEAVAEYPEIAKEIRDLRLDIEAGSAQPGAIIEMIKKVIEEI